jgi:hypothetical protein
MNTENKRQNRIPNLTKEKYTNFLNEVYTTLQDNNYINMNIICCDFKIGRQIPTMLTRQKIIKIIGRNKYIWIGKKPSSQMVNLIIEKARIYCAESKYKQKKTGQKEIDFKTPVIKPVFKPVEKPIVRILNPTNKEVKIEKQNYSFSILWGLVKIQKS